MRQQRPCDTRAQPSSRIAGRRGEQGAHQGATPTKLAETVAPDAVVWGSIGLTGRPEAARSDLAAWTAFVETEQGKQTLFHFDVQDDHVVAIEEQYRP